MSNRSIQRRQWVYPVLYAAVFIICMLPPYAEQPYAPQETQAVIIELLKVATTPYSAYAPIFHVVTLVLVALIAWQPAKMGPVWAAYMGVNYLIIALAQTMGTTAQYGFVLHTGGLVLYTLLGLIWLVVALRRQLQTSFQSVTWQKLLLLPLALLAFWAPYGSSATAVWPDFNPLLLLVSPDYGLTFCLTTPVFLFLLILCYPHVNPLAYRMTAFSGLLYGLLNLTHWFTPELRWMGFLHLPLLILSAYALILPRIQRRRAAG